MQTKTKLKGIKERNYIRQWLGGSILALAIFMFGFLIVPFLVAEASATTVSVGAAWNTVSLSFDPDVAATSSAADPAAEQALPTHGDVIFGDIVPTSMDENIGNLGTMRVIKKTLGVETAGQYYSIYLSMSGDSNRLLLNNTNMYIEPTNGTWNNPTAFTGSSWGYAVPTGNATSGTFITPFSTPAVYNNYDTLLGRDLTKTGTGSSVYNTGLWAAVPINDINTAPQQIWKAETSNTNGFGGELGDDIKDHFDIYFATIIDTNVMAGTYENNITYTAIASSANLDSASTNLSRSLEFVGEGSEEVLSFDLSASTSTITQDQVKVYLVPHYIVEHSDYTITSDYTAYKVAANTCTITSLTTTSAGATATCTLPASPNGIDDGITAEDTVTYEIDDGEGGTTTETVTIEKGEFDLWLNIEDYGYNYLSRYTKELDPIASIVYAGLQSTDKNGNTYITEMQEMTGTFCKNTSSYNSDNSVATTFSLEDVRDNASYDIRKLGDDCWMVSNLRFVGSGIGNETQLTSATSDIDDSYTDTDPLMLTFGEGAGTNTSTTPKIHIGTDSESNGTVWYNYASATAMTMVGADVTVASEYSICPRGWTLPTKTQATAVAADIDSFNPVAGGIYFPMNEQQHHYDGTGYWWLSSPSSITNKRSILKYSSTNGTGSTGADWIGMCVYVRCVARD